MKRKIVSLFLLVTLCLNLAVCASASDADFIKDSFGIFSEDELGYLNEIASELYEMEGVGVYYDYTTTPDLLEYDVTALVGDQTDYFVMVENADSWYYYASGQGEVLDADLLREIYDETATYIEGVEAYLGEVAVQLAVNGGGSEAETVEDDLLVWDEAELLSEAEVSALNAKLQTISETYNAEIHVVTMSSMGGGNIDDFQHFLYDGYGFGYGENHDGVLLLVCMDPREYRVLSNGFAGEAITGSEISSMGDAFVSDLSDGNYAAAFDIFADECEYYLNGYINGFPFDVTTSLLTAVGIGLLIGIIVATILKGQLKSVHMQNQAAAYVKAGSLQITHAGDYFLYRNVVKTERKESSSSSSSSGGGSSRSTGGGSF